MKRFLAITVAIIMIVCSFAACGESASGSADLKALLDNINSTYSLTGLKVLESASDLNRYYMIAEEDVKQFAAELTTAASEYNEVIIVEAASSSAVDSVAAKLDSHLDAQINTAKSYDKDAQAMVEACKVEKSGNYVYLVIGDNAADINKMIADAIK